MDVDESFFLLDFPPGKWKIHCAVLGLEGAFFDKKNENENLILKRNVCRILMHSCAKEDNFVRF